MNLEDLPLFAGAEQSKSPPQAPAHWTITELTARIRGVLEPAFTEVWVQGEVSNLRPAASGHLYLTLKDANASISAAIFGWGKRRAPFEMKDGLQVQARGRLSVYPPRGSYQLTIDQIMPVGAGALTLQYEKLKTKLQAEGLFDPKRKRPLPKFPRRIAVVTSPSGAAIRDMLNILARRAPHIQVTLIPALVQGAEASCQIAEGLEKANRYDLGEIVVLARGGGSFEDLHCFNDEALARAIAASRLPVVSAVGHEIDFTISDFVSDLRAPTPSAAAEIVSGHWVEAAPQILQLRSRVEQAMLRDVRKRAQLLAHLAARVVNPRDRLREQVQRCDDLEQRLRLAVTRVTEQRKLQVRQWAGRLGDPRLRVRQSHERCVELGARLERALERGLERRQGGVEQLAGKLDALSPLRVLDRGYSLVRTPEGKIVRSAADLKAKDRLQIRFQEGEARVEVL